MNTKHIQLGPFMLGYVSGTRQVSLLTTRVTLTVGLPFEWPNRKDLPGRVRIGFGPFAASLYGVKS